MIPHGNTYIYYTIERNLLSGNFCLPVAAKITAVSTIAAIAAAEIRGIFSVGEIWAAKNDAENQPAANEQ
jgi:hypothetical protein